MPTRKSVTPGPVFAGGAASGLEPVAWVWLSLAALLYPALTKTTHGAKTPTRGSGMDRTNPAFNKNSTKVKETV